MEQYQDCPQCGKHALNVMYGLGCYECGTPMAATEEPESLEQYKARREEVAKQRVADDLQKSIDATRPTPKAEGENDHSRMKQVNIHGKWMW